MKKYSLLLLLVVSLVATYLVAAEGEPEAPPLPDPESAEFAEAEATILTLASVSGAEDEPEECTGSTPNLLTNPSFEGQYSDYVPDPPIPDCPWGVCFSAQMSPGWTPYWQSHNDATDEGWEMLMPEYKAATTAFTDPVRVRSGEFAQQLFTFYATHNAGLFQQVYGVVPGQTYCLSIWGHSWSSHDDEAHTDLSNHGFLNQRIGIDPFGGKAFTSNNIIWTPPVTQYDEYGLFKLEVEAQSDTLTVFFNSNPLYAAKHNDVYWDDAILVQAGQREPAEMVVEPGWVNFSADSYTTIDRTETLSVTIKNDWEGNLTWSAQVLPNAPFDVALRQVGDKLHLDIDSDGLSAGEHKATVQINASDFGIINAQKYVTIQIDVVQSDPLVRLSSAEIMHMLDIDELEAQSGSVQIDLLNIEGLEDVKWQAEVEASSDFTPEMTKSDGLDGEMLDFQYDPSDMALGVHKATVMVTASSADGDFANQERFTLTVIVAEDVYNAALPTILR